MKEITLYSKTVCGTCLFVKNQLGLKGITYVEKNMDTDDVAKQKILDAGIMSAPVLEVDGELLVKGEIMEFLEG